MDWSLVLVSQGIQTVIDHDGELGWNLVVDDLESERALTILDQYRVENLRWPWQQQVVHPHISFDWGCVPWVLLLCVFFWLSERVPGLREVGVMDGAAVSHGQWWRLFTAMCLHADTAHIAANAGIGFVLLGLTMGRYGTGIGLLAAFLAGAMGNVASLLVDPGHRNLGASGMVMGALGLLAVQTVVMLRHNRANWRYVVGGIAGGIMLFTLTGVAPGTDVMAHFGGFASGVVIGVILNFLPPLARNTPANAVAGATFAALVIVSWWLALSSK